MKKFNPENELRRIKTKSIKGSNSRFSGMYVPILVIACSCLAMCAVTFSAKLEEETKNKFTVRVDIVNGNQDVLIRNVNEGEFSSLIESENAFGSIECSDGNLEYDAVTSMVYSKNINQNTHCTLYFTEEATREVSPNGLDGINDNTGRSYYYKADATNNYLSLNNMLFRIIRINGDGSYRLLLENSSLTSTYGENNEYIGSNIEKTLNDWFTNNFHEEGYLVESDFDKTNYSGYETDDLINFDGYLVSYVGTLSVREATILTDGVEENNYLEAGGGFYLMNANGPDNVYVYRNGKVDSVGVEETLLVKPVINVTGKLVGDGTRENPFTLE